MYFDYQIVSIKKQMIAGLAILLKHPTMNWYVTVPRIHLFYHNVTIGPLQSYSESGNYANNFIQKVMEAEIPNIWRFYYYSFSDEYFDT